MKKHSDSNEQLFTSSGAVLGFIAYLGVVYLITWVFI